MRVGIDIGGTFTDFVVFQPETGILSTFKLLSTPANPAEAVLKGLALISARQSEQGNPVPGSSPAALQVIHGSTVATNALLERKGALTTLVTTAGFRDILQIGRQNRPELYDLSVSTPPALIPQDLRLEVNERIDRHGNILTALDPEEVDGLRTRVENITNNRETAHKPAVAICLLFSFTNPIHEQYIARQLRAAGFFVSVSSELIPEYREYERTSTTVVNAYVSPILETYLRHLETAVPGMVRVMQSNGGIIGLDEARRSGVRCILSGPAGGLIGAEYIARCASQQNGANSLPEANFRPAPVNVITFDMGGTSTDVSLITDKARLTTETVVGGYPIHLPVLDIHTIGAGGGSIATVDRGGALRVGPQSAGADPGPACYGRGGELATVTDANLVLGRLPAEHFLGGEMPLTYQAAAAALTRLGGDLGLSAISAAQGVIEVVNAHMERALRVISVERGHDPGDFSLLSFGGAGGLHAADLARHLGIPRVIVPPLASTLSAFGMLAADVIKDYTQTVMFSGETSRSSILSAFAPLVQQGRRAVQAEGFAANEVQIEQLLDMRYRGQSYELSVPLQDDIYAAFHTAHHQAYGYARREIPLEIVNIRVRAIGRVTPPALIAQPGTDPDPSQALIDLRPVWFDRSTGLFPAVPFYNGENLLPGNIITGPAVIVRSDTTVLLSPLEQAKVDPLLNLVIAVIGPRR